MGLQVDAVAAVALAGTVTVAIAPKVVIVWNESAGRAGVYLNTALLCSVACVLNQYFYLSICLIKLFPDLFAFFFNRKINVVKIRQSNGHHPHKSITSFVMYFYGGGLQLATSGPFLNWQIAYYLIDQC